MNNILNALIFCKFRVSYVVTRPIYFKTYPFPLFRGVFGDILKKDICVMDPTDNNCKECSYNSNCPYTVVFHRMELPETHNLTGKHTKPPVPYTFYTDILPNRSYLKGDIFSIDLTLFGTGAIGYKTIMIQNLQQLPERGGGIFNKFKYAGTLLTANNRNSPSYFDSADKEINSVTINFESPLILENKNEPDTSLPFNSLMYRNQQRVFLLNNLYCDNTPEQNFTPIQDSSISEFSNLEKVIAFKYKGSIKKGLMGQVTYNGNLGPYLPLIKAGELLHIGKFSNYGLGKYSIIDCS